MRQKRNTGGTDWDERHNSLSSFLSAKDYLRNSVFILLNSNLTSYTPSVANSVSACLICSSVGGLGMSQSTASV